MYFIVVLLSFFLSFFLSFIRSFVLSFFRQGLDALSSGVRRKFYFAPSERVLVLRFGNLWYNATVSAVNEDDGSYGVDYEDGDKEARVEAARIMTFKVSASESHSFIHSLARPF